MDFDELLYDEIYAEDFSPRLKHFEYGTHSLEIFVTTVSLMKIFSREIGSVDDWKKDHDTAPSWKEELVPPGGLKEWLAEGRVPQTLDGHEVIGGLRLLCQFWKPSDEISKDKYVIPFKDEDTLRELLNTFQLPHCFPHDLIRRRYIPTRVQPIHRDGRNRMAIVCQSLDYEHAFMTMALSYDPLTGISSGFLGGEVNSSGRGPVTKLLDQLKRVAACATQPMLLPILTYGIWCDRLRVQVRNDALDVTDIQRSTGLMDEYLYKYTQPKIARGNSANYNTIHKKLIIAHASLTNDVSRFVEDFGKGCEGGLGLFHQFTEGSVPESSVEKRRQQDESRRASGSLIQDFSHQRDISEATLRSFLDHWLITERVALQQRDQQLARVNMQLQVLYNLMQQRVAEEQQRVALETKRDSNAMKSIALLTMVFLPSTALATIFSMSSFFTLDSQTFQLHVSSDFWIFWAIAIPLTGLVVFIWTLWIQRTEIKNIRQRLKAWWKAR